MSCGGDDMADDEIRAVKVRHERALLQLPGVVSVGIGLSEEGRQAIIVGLDGPRPETRAQLPAELDGYPLELREIGTPRAQ